MPDASGKLTADERQKLAEWLNERAPKASCPMCQTSAWTITGVLVALNVSPPDRIQIGGITLPVVPVACSNCGYVGLISAVIAGLMSGDEPPKASETPEAVKQVSNG